MSATPRQRLQDEITAAATQFAARIVDALVAFEHSESENDDGKPKRKKTPTRVPFVPTGKTFTPEQIEEARHARRRLAG